MKPRNGHWTSEATVSLYLSLPKETHFLQVNTKTGVYLHLSFPTPLSALHIVVEEEEHQRRHKPRSQIYRSSMLAGPTWLTRLINFANHQIRWVDWQFLVPMQKSRAFRSGRPIWHMFQCTEIGTFCYAYSVPMSSRTQTVFRRIQPDQHGRLIPQTGK